MRWRCSTTAAACVSSRTAMSAARGVSFFSSVLVSKLEVLTSPRASPSRELLAAVGKRLLAFVSCLFFQRCQRARAFSRPASTSAVASLRVAASTSESIAATAFACSTERPSVAIVAKTEVGIVILSKPDRSLVDNCTQAKARCTSKSPKTLGLPRFQHFPQACGKLMRQWVAAASPARPHLAHTLAPKDSQCERRMASACGVSGRHAPACCCHLCQHQAAMCERHPE